MTAAQKELIQATVPILREHGVALTTHFYKRMFTFNPELKHVFNMGNQKNGKQQMALALAVLAYAENIENPVALMPAVNHIGHKHVSLDIRPEHYQIVGRHLLASIKEVLGDEAATPELMEAWKLAYEQLARIMSSHEMKLYNEQIEKSGGWTGWRPFLVKTKLVESSEIISFHLYPADGGPIALHTPGQYISVRTFIPELNLMQPRQYSISSGPNQLYYRISVKRERIGTENGLISNHLHDHIQEGDTLEVSAPSGAFILSADTDKPIVLISGGVGQTPLLSMLESLLDAGYTQPIQWIHGCRNAEVHAFRDSLSYWETEYPQLNTHIFYNEVPETEDSGSVYQGFVDTKVLPSEVMSSEALYYLCGPSAFLIKQYKDLQALGIPKDSIYFEEFGPQRLSF